MYDIESLLTIDCDTVDIFWKGRQYIIETRKEMCFLWYWLEAEGVLKY